MSSFPVKTCILGLFCISALGMAGLAAGQQAAAPADDSPSTAAFKAADAQMVTALGAPMTGNSDKDFLSDLIAHDQGDIAIAKIALRFSADRDLRSLADDIISARQKEIEKLTKMKGR